MAHAVSQTYARFDHMSPTALTLATLLHAAVAVALWWASPLRYADAPLVTDPIDITVERAPKPPEPPPPEQKIAVAPAPPPAPPLAPPARMGLAPPRTETDPSAKPGVDQPALSPKPQTSAKEPDKPEADKPEVAKPEAAKPEPAKPEVATPEPPKPEPPKPEPAKPEPAKPELAKPAEPVEQGSRQALAVPPPSPPPPATTPDVPKPAPPPRALEKAVPPVEAPPSPLTAREIPAPIPPPALEKAVPPLETPPPLLTSRDIPKPAPPPPAPPAAAAVPKPPAPPPVHAAPRPPQRLQPSPLTNPSARGPSNQQASRQSPTFVNPADMYGERKAEEQYLWAVARQIAQHQEFIGNATSESGSVVLRLTIARDGRLLGVSVSRSSGSSSLDRGSLNIIRQVAPYPPLPPEIGGAQHTFNLPLYFKRS